MESLFTQDDVIYSYTRKQAIEDGVLVDVSETAKEAGFKFPVAVTHAVWYGVIEAPEKAVERGESDNGRLWDVLFMLYVSVKAGKMDGYRLDYTVQATDQDGNPKDYQLKAECHGGDNGEPVITIMFPEED